MKRQLLQLSVLSVLLGWSYASNAQELLKDLEAGANVSSNPQQFTNVNGTVYFITDPNSNRRHALWKTDGTADGTVMVKDSLINTAVSDRCMIRGTSHDTLYYTINTNVQGDTTTELWMVKNGSSPVLVTLLTSRMLNQFSNGEPRKYAMAGGKLFFQMYTDHGYELWVSDGTEAGTHEVADLFPGSTSGIANGGTNDLAMMEYKGKLYFQGITSFTGPVGLYSSDGSAATLVKEGTAFNPQSFTVYNNMLYFQAKEAGVEGMWKTDGTTNGTVNVTATGFNSDVVIFKNAMYYNVGSKMYKSDGTTAGTENFMDSVGIILGANSNYFLSRYMRTFSTPPYYEYYFWRSDGTAAGTERVADSIGNAGSFVLLNDKMYSSAGGTGLWESDGTTAGTTKLLAGIVNYPIIVNNKVVFSNFGTGTGYEPWIYTPAGIPSGIFDVHAENMNLTIYPNPSTGYFQLNVGTNANIEVYNTTGEQVYHASITEPQAVIDLSNLTKGVYFVKVNDGAKFYRSAIVLQ